MQQMLTCPNCSSQNASNQQFCVSCGAHLGNTQRPVSHVPIVTGVAAPTPIVSGAVTPTATVSQTQTHDQFSRKPIDVKPTWGLAWGLFWRTLFLLLFMAGVVFLIYLIIRMIIGYHDVFGSW